jgi:hypothetical protein
LDAEPPLNDITVATAAIASTILRTALSCSSAAIADQQSGELAVTQATIEAG